MLINRKNISKFLSVYKFYPFIFFGKSEHILLLSHMRSRSSLLSHILGSNEEISGYSEMHQSYRSNFDYIKSKIKIFSSLEEHVKTPFFYDKILHNTYKVSYKMILRKNTKILFLIREPEGTITSLLNMSKINEPTIREIEIAVTYYIRRLLYLRELSTIIKPSLYHFIDSDNLINNAKNELHVLTEWLGLKKPLTNNYNTFKHTGQKGYGDFSSNIHAGTIIKSKVSNKVYIPEYLLIKARKQYYSFIENISCRQS